MNESTNFFSCEIKCNYKLCVDYLKGETSPLSLPDTNNNLKILRYQIIGVSYPASFGFMYMIHVFWK